jgi:hypothetical protein
MLRVPEAVVWAGVSSLTVPLPLPSTAVSAVGVTLMLAVAWLEEPPLLSVAVKWKLVLPFQLGAGLEVEGDGARGGLRGVPR